MPLRQPIDIDGATGEVLKLPPKRKRAKLDTLQDVRLEMAKVYREARSGLVDNQDATKQVWMLQAIGRVIIDYEIEKRIEALENLNP